MSTRPATRPAIRRSLASRLADAVVFVIGLASVLAVAEMVVRPFYPAPPELVAPQVRHRASRTFGWEMVPDPAAMTFSVAAPIDNRGDRVGEATAAPTTTGATPAADVPAARWLVAGAGNAFGVAIPWDAAYPALAAGGAGTGVALINTATEGYDLDQKTRRIEAEAMVTAPDLILLEVDPSDLSAAVRHDTLGPEAGFVPVSARLNRQPAPRDNPYAWLLQRSRLASLLDGRARSFLNFGRDAAPTTPPANVPVRAIDLLLGRETPAIETAWQGVGAALDRVARAADGVRARVCVVALPLPAQLRRPYPRATFQPRLERLCRERGFLFVDPLPALREARRGGTRLYLPRLAYLGEAGHRTVGDQIRRELETPLAHEERWRLPSRVDE